MATGPCRECGHQASWSARWCPNCGARNPVARPAFDLYDPSTWREAPLRQRIWAAVLILFLIVLIASLF